MEWTPDKEDELEKHWNSGATAGQIAKLMCLTKNQVLGKSHRMKLTPRPSPIVKKGKPVKASIRNQIAILMVEAPARKKPLPRKRAPSSGGFLQCQYPFGDDPLTMTFCGKKTTLRLDGGRSPYCDKHHKLCHVRWYKEVA